MRVFVESVDRGRNGSFQGDGSDLVSVCRQCNERQAYALGR
jgi:hypothetical protein